MIERKGKRVRKNSYNQTSRLLFTIPAPLVDLDAFELHPLGYLLDLRAGPVGVALEFSLKDLTLFFGHAFTPSYLFCFLCGNWLRFAARFTAHHLLRAPVQAFLRLLVRLRRGIFFQDVIPYCFNIRFSDHVRLALVYLLR